MPREGRHELSPGFVQHLKHLSPLQGFYAIGVSLNFGVSFHNRNRNLIDFRIIVVVAR